MKEIFVITTVFFNNLNEFLSIMTQVREDETSALETMSNFLNDNYESHSDVENNPKEGEYLYKAYGYGKYSKALVTITRNYI